MKENENFEEGTEILDPELKAIMEEQEKLNAEKVEKMRAMNKAITGFLNEMQENHDLKIYLVGRCDSLDEMGVWKSDNLNQLEEMGFVKLMENQF